MRPRKRWQKPQTRETGRSWAVPMPNLTMQYVNPEELLERFGSPGFTRQVIRIFQEEYGQLESSLDAAYQKNDQGVSFSRECHKLKGSLSMLAGHDLAREASRLEQKALRNRCPCTAAEYSQFRQMLSVFFQELSSLVETHFDESMRNA